MVVCHKAIPGPSTELPTSTRASKESFKEQLIYFELDNASLHHQKDCKKCSKLREVSSRTLDVLGVSLSTDLL